MRTLWKPIGRTVCSNLAAGLSGMPSASATSLPMSASKLSTARSRTVSRRCPAMTQGTRPPPAAVVALPLFYAGFRGRSVGILSLATRSNDSPLLSLAKDAGRLAQISQVLDDWYGAELARALGVIAAAEFWHP